MSVARTKPRSRRINAWRDKKKRKGREEERNRVCIYIYGQWNILYLPLYLSPNGIESRHCWETTGVEEEADKENKKKNKRNKRDKCSERFLGTYWRTIKKFIRWINQRNFILRGLPVKSLFVSTSHHTFLCWNLWIRYVLLLHPLLEYWIDSIFGNSRRRRIRKGIG